MLIQYNMTNILIVNEKLKLIPGVNEVGYDVWKEACLNTTIQDRIERDEIIELSGAKTASEDSSSNSITKFKNKDALKMVKATIDLNLLKKWKAEDKRPEIIEAISDRQELLKLPEPKKDE